LRSFAALLLGLSAFNAQATPVAATWDTDEVLTTPVTYRHIHGLIYSHIAFQVLLPVAWNGKVMIKTLTTHYLGFRKRPLPQMNRRRARRFCGPIRRRGLRVWVCQVASPAKGTGAES
jgi:hypothetical protein